jgi:exonuclease SbcC
MTLSALHITSFAALAALDIPLEPGLNTVLGPNEAGKTTLFKALQHLLLTPVKLNKRSFQERVEPLLPVGGGDTVSCSVEFQVGREPYVLQKSWGAESAAELRLPDGSRLTDAEAVEARILNLLPVQPGTLKTVLLTGQSGLATTLEELRSDSETVYGLSDLLHRSALETDGISVGRFQETLNRLYQESFKHWDRQRQRPESKRSGDVRWSRDAGSVLNAYYAMEDAGSRHREVKEREDSLGLLTSQLEDCTRELAEKEKELEIIEAGAKDAEKRSVLEAGLKETELSFWEVQVHYESWTKNLLRRDAIDKEIPGLEGSVLELDQENIRVRSYLEKKELVERFRRIQAKRQRLKQAETTLSTLSSLPRRQLDRLRDGASEIDRLKAALQAGNLSLTFHAGEAIDLRTQKDMEEPADRHLSSGKDLTIEAAGKIEIRHPAWNLEVFSGRGEYKKVAEQCEQAQSRYAQLLKELNVSSMEEAAETSKRYEDQHAEMETARSIYEQELGSDTFETLEAACGAGTDSPPPREQSRVLEEFVETRNRLQNLQSERQEIRRSLENLEEQYGNKEALFNRIAELGGIKQEMVRKSAGLSPLPEGYSEAQTLLDDYKELTRQHQLLVQRRIRLESDLKNAEASLPEESSEEAARRLEDVREHFDGELKKAEILVRIRATTEDLLTELDEGVYAPFTGLVSRYLANLSNGRYRGIAADPVLPGGVIRGDGRTLTYHLLSAGTKDLFALAVRLAMAEFFLGDREGFLLLDDPLVDLDPGRQKRAAAILEEFAEKHQLVLFTCQPTHASMFAGAHRIELEG